MAETVESGVQNAIQLEEKGQIKEAYFAFITSSQSALTYLQETKFVRSSIVSSPRQYPVLLDSLKISLAHIESIIQSNSPVIQKVPPPPLPPKPNRIKPSVPPRPPPPVPQIPQIPQLSPPSESSSSSLSSLSQPQIQSQVQPPTPPARQVGLQDNSTYTTTSTSTSSSSLSSIYQPDQRSSLNVPQPQSRIPSPDPMFSQQPQRLPEENDSVVSIVAEGQIDPNYLVPAQTNAGDSLAVPTSNHHHHSTDHVPLIPVPPLLTTHRQLQQKLSDLEEKLQQCKEQLRNNDATDETDQMIHHYMQLIAETRITLNGVRTLYMSAGTIPSVLQFSPVIMAYQITLIEATIFNAIPPTALLEHSSRHPHPRIVASTDFFNYVTRYIEHSILLPQDASNRAQLVHYWIKVASRCLDINNYQTLKAVVSALNTPPVQRLKRTWAYVPRKSASKLESLDELMSESNNYGNYRENLGVENSPQLLAHFAKPTVPFLGTFIHDITYLLAAYKKSGHYDQPQDEPRIQTVLNTMSRFQRGPRYTPHLPGSLLRSGAKLKPSFSSAFQKGASKIQRISGNFGFDSSSVSDEEDDDIEAQQKLATQFILMRPWVNQTTVDELSQLREPSQPKQPNRTGNRSSSMMSSSSSVRLSNASTNSSSRPTSSEESGFWPFNRRSDVTRPVTIHEGVENKPDVPPRPVTTTEDELRIALANRLAKVHEKH